MGSQRNSPLVCVITLAGAASQRLAGSGADSPIRDKPGAAPAPQPVAFAPQPATFAPQPATFAPQPATFAPQPVT